MYSHLLKDCKATEDVCGKYAGAHRTSACTVSNPKQLKCINCPRCSSKKSSTASSSNIVNQHAAGDRRCPEQIRALERLKNLDGEWRSHSGENLNPKSDYQLLYQQRGVRQTLYRVESTAPTDQCLLSPNYQQRVFFT
ncbi:hypothetical protein OUZ56_012307 [Daphnia magna]|uniref:Uncharacterized protein n=1 Tax=Daphnia magna TaxID=35525 RepID=A0ABQ9Z2L7_9CRUS|nr:hypothetical protein OUZ56_012307 [Daphnia magna]